MPRQLDIIPVGSRFQVFDLSTNSPVGNSFATRWDAERYMSELYADDYGYTIQEVQRAVRPSQKARTTTELAEQTADVSAGRTVGGKPNG